MVQNFAPSQTALVAESGWVSPSSVSGAVLCLWHISIFLQKPQRYTQWPVPPPIFFRDRNCKSCNFHFKNQAKRPPPAHRSLVPTRSGNRLAMHPNQHTPIDKHLFHQKVTKGDSKNFYLLYNITTAATTVTKSSRSCQWLMHPFPFHLIKKKNTKNRIRSAEGREQSSK